MGKKRTEKLGDLPPVDPIICSGVQTLWGIFADINNSRWGGSSSKVDGLNLCDKTLDSSIWQPLLWSIVNCVASDSVLLAAMKISPDSTTKELYNNYLVATPSLATMSISDYKTALSDPNNSFVNGLFQNLNGTPGYPHELYIYAYQGTRDNATAFESGIQALAACGFDSTPTTAQYQALFKAINSLSAPLLAEKADPFCQLIWGIFNNKFSSGHSLYDYSSGTAADSALDDAFVNHNFGPQLIALGAFGCHIMDLTNLKKTKAA